MKLSQAEVIAGEVVKLLAEACAQIWVAGSVRRRKTEVHDIELVAVPRGELVSQAPLLPGFGTVLAGTSPLEVRVSELIDGGLLAYDHQVRRNGAKYKRFILHDQVVELFIASPDNAGNILALRTGDSDFSHALVTHRREGGLLPGHLVQRDGYLWHGGERIPCPDEKTFFAALGVHPIEPQFRNAANAKNLARHVMEISHES